MGTPTIKTEAMTETKKSLAILKARWPEVTLIIGLYTLVELSPSQGRNIEKEFEGKSPADLMSWWNEIQK